METEEIKKIDSKESLLDNSKESIDWIDSLQEYAENTFESNHAYELAQIEKTQTTIDALAEIPLKVETANIVKEIINEDNIDKTKEMLEKFNLNIAKKNAIRIIKLNSLLDSVHDQALNRFEKYPDSISNTDLLAYMNTVQNSIDKSQAALKEVDQLNIPTIQVNQQKVNINMNPDLSSKSKAKVIDAINALLKIAQNTEDLNDKDSSIIEGEVVEKESLNLKKSEESEIKDNSNQIE